ncbi:MAG: hypothetical protein JWL71_4935 [Acidobacteria bacterium]|nr:hypothetical protein [Acidobacteriota bacterium]
MIMRVNSKCAHQLRPPLSRITLAPGRRYTLREPSQVAVTQHWPIEVLIADISLAMPVRSTAIGRVGTRLV